MVSWAEKRTLMAVNSINERKLDRVEGRPPLIKLALKEPTACPAADRSVWSPDGGGVASRQRQTC